MAWLADLIDRAFKNAGYITDNRPLKVISIFSRHVANLNVISASLHYTECKPPQTQQMVPILVL